MRDDITEYVKETLAVIHGYCEALITCQKHREALSGNRCDTAEIEKEAMLGLKEEVTLLRYIRSQRRTASQDPSSP